MVKINKIKIGNGNPLVLIAGPCVVENEKITLKTAEAIKAITDELGIPFIFKASYKKANRTSIHSFSGIHFDKALKILAKVKKELALPILTDVHDEREVDPISHVADIIQIPAFLCRQTDLLVAAGRTGKSCKCKKRTVSCPAGYEARNRKN